MTHTRYKYVGDNTGTDLTRGTEYEVVTRGVDNIVLQVERSHDTVEITKEEFQHHRKLGTLKPTQ